MINSNERKLKASKGLLIFAYGFEQAGFTIPREPLIIGGIGEIRFILLDDSHVDLDQADGIIMPQGIFEAISPSKYSHTRTTVYVNKEVMLERERQVFNLIREGKWVCFLVRKIVDRVSQDYETQDISDTDLCKRILNGFGISRESSEGKAYVLPTVDEFKPYIKQYGVAKTIFSLYRCEIEHHALAKDGEKIVGFEINNNIYFLPFHTTKKDPESLKLIIGVLVRAICDYRQKRTADKPSWLNDFKFSKEEKLRSKSDELIEEARKMQSELLVWEDYKTILTTSGPILANKIVNILSEYFGLKVDATDEYKEDAKILNDNGEVIIVLEAKGTKSGVKREHINQVDSHRERGGYSNSMPGILTINNEMSISGIDERLSKEVAEEQIKHAVKMNVLVIRAIDLLLIMRQLEEAPDRKDKIVKILSLGGGWLKATKEGYELKK